jgi:hypothetical protein
MILFLLFSNSIHILISKACHINICWLLRKNERKCFTPSFNVFCKRQYTTLRFAVIKVREYVRRTSVQRKDEIRTIRTIRLILLTFYVYLIDMAMTLLSPYRSPIAHITRIECISVFNQFIRPNAVTSGWRSSSNDSSPEFVSSRCYRCCCIVNRIRTVSQTLWKRAWVAPAWVSAYNYSNMMQSYPGCSAQSRSVEKPHMAVTIAKEDGRVPLSCTAR